MNKEKFLNKVRPFDGQVILMGATPFSGKTMFFEELNDLGYGLKRLYDNTRNYDGLYVHDEVLFVDLDTDAFHFFELLDNIQIRMLIEEYVVKIINNYEDGNGNKFQNHNINCVLAIGHVNTRNSINIVNNSDVEDLARDNLEIYNDRNFVNRLKIRDKHAAMMYNLKTRARDYNLVLNTESFKIPEVPEWVNSIMRNSLLREENDVFVVNKRKYL